MFVTPHLRDMVNTAINLYSVRNLDKPVETLISRVADAGYDGVQFAGTHAPAPGNAESIAEMLTDHGLQATPPHIGIDALDNELDAVIKTYDPVGVDGAVIPWMDKDCFVSAGAVDELAGRVNKLAATLNDRGWDLLYHNHAHEFTDLDGQTAFDRFVEATEVDLEVDVGWALTGGTDPAGLIRTLGDRVRTVHMKDMDTSVEHGFVELGEGDVDVKACADAARSVDADWLIYEHDDPDDPDLTIENGAAALDAV
jgi:sugar phosphate isomerase/epimerase